MKFKGMEVDKMLMLLSDVTKGEQNHSNANIRELLATMYGQLTGKYEPIVRALPALSGPIAKDLTPIVCTVADMVSSIAESAGFKKSKGRLDKACAELRMASMKAHESAGFSHEEAFYLVLKDASRKLSMPKMSSSSSSEE